MRYVIDAKLLSLSDVWAVGGGRMCRDDVVVGVGHVFRVEAWLEIWGDFALRMACHPAETENISPLINLLQIQ